MAIVDTEIKLFLSNPAATAGNQLAQADPNASLGKFVSTTEFNGLVNGMFDDVTGAENATNDVEYRLVFVKNTNATTTLQNAKVFFQSQVAGGTDLAVAVDNIAVSGHASATAQAATVANENTAPTGVGAFSAPSTAGTGLALGDIGPNQVKGIWVRRTASNSAPVANDGGYLAVAGDTL